MQYPLQRHRRLVGRLLRRSSRPPRPRGPSPPVSRREAVWRRVEECDGHVAVWVVCLPPARGPTSPGLVLLTHTNFTRRIVFATVATQREFLVQKKPLSFYLCTCPPLLSHKEFTVLFSFYSSIFLFGHCHPKLSFPIPTFYFRTSSNKEEATECTSLKKRKQCRIGTTFIKQTSLSLQRWLCQRHSIFNWNL